MKRNPHYFREIQVGEITMSWPAIESVFPTFFQNKCEMIQFIHSKDGLAAS